ncbi:hypothetical protein ACOMHN_066967 [Nucella lapillus]
MTGMDSGSAAAVGGPSGGHPDASPWIAFKAEQETLTPVDTVITGQMPEWLSGSLYRNGCGVFEEGAAERTHLFEGYGVLHRYQLDQGRVRYTSRILHREAWLRSLKAHRLAVAENGQTQEYLDPCTATFSRLAVASERTDSGIPRPLHGYLLLHSSATYYQRDEAGKGKGKGKGEKSREEEEEEDRTGVNIVRHSDKLFALTESPVLQEVDPETLSLQSKTAIQKVVSVHMSTAHPLMDRDGSMYNLATAFASSNHYNIIKIPPHALDSEEEVARRMKLVASVQSRWTMGISYNHSFGMTDRHFILLEQPATLNPLTIMPQGGSGHLKPASVFRQFELHPKEKLRFHVISRRQGNKVLSTQYYANPCFTFHFVNCYDDGDYLVVDLVSYDNLSIINDLMLSHIADSTDDIITSTMRRYVLPLNLGKSPQGHNLPTLPYTKARAKVTSPGVVHLTPDYICPPKDKVYIELPRINYELFSGRKYRYVYGTTMLTKLHRLIKLDLDTRTPTYWEEEGCDPGEPVFVPRPGATEEDDGVVLSPVICLRKHKDKPCFLLILDARSFTELARATTPQGVRIAPSFHGNFYMKSD